MDKAIQRILLELFGIQVLRLYKDDVFVKRRGCCWLLRFLWKQYGSICVGKKAEKFVRDCILVFERSFPQEFIELRGSLWYDFF